jgi:predicted  nucleic acid-binding Zn-ribbon protein
MEETLKLILHKLNSMDSDIKDLKSEFKTIGNQVTKIENDHGLKLDSLLDGYKQLYEGQHEIKNDIQNLQQKQEHQDIEIRVMNNKTKAI